MSQSLYDLNQRQKIAQLAADEEDRAQVARNFLHSIASAQSLGTKEQTDWMISQAQEGLRRSGEDHDLPDALEAALDALSEVMGCDKGMSEPDWIDFCNRNLILMHEHGRCIGIVSYS